MNFLMFFPNPSNPASGIPGGWAFSDTFADIETAAASGQNILVPYNHNHNVVTTSNTAPNFAIGGLGKIVLAENQIIAGADEFTSTITVSGPGGAFELSSKNSRIYSLRFIGPGKASGNIFSRAITTWNIGWKIEGCRFSGFSGTTGGGAYGGGAIMCVGNASGTIDYKFGASIKDCEFDNNETDINIVQRAEFLNIVDTIHRNSGTAIANQGGNNKIRGAQALFATVAYRQYAGSNDGHGSLTDCYFNHCGTSFWIEDQSLGVKITGCMSYGGAGEGKITITNSNRVVFMNCDLDSGDSMTLTNNAVGGVKVYGGWYNPAGYVTRNVTGPDLVVV